MPGSTVSRLFSRFVSIPDQTSATDVWTHGDFITIHPITKQVIFSGRSDGVLNPSGIRFGSAEIYNVLETQFASEVSESICVGQRRPQDLDESVFLFVQMQPNRKFTESLVQCMRDAIRKLLSPRHVPKYIFETPEIPVCLFVGVTFHVVKLT